MIRTLIDGRDSDSIRFDISTYGPKGTINWTTSGWLTLWYLAGRVWFALGWISYAGHIENELINIERGSKRSHLCAGITDTWGVPILFHPTVRSYSAERVRTSLGNNLSVERIKKRVSNLPVALKFQPQEWPCRSAPRHEWRHIKW